MSASTRLQLHHKRCNGNKSMCFVQAGFTSLAHTDEDIEATIAAAQQVFAEI